MAVSPETTIVVDWLCLVLTYLVCGLRLIVICTRSRKKIRSHFDTEFFLCLALATATAAVIANTVKNSQLIRDRSFKNTVGLRSTSAVNTSPEAQAKIMTLKFLYAQSFVYFVIVWLIKAAFLSIYFHFRQKMTRACKIALYVLTALVVVTFLVITLMMFVTCLPIERAWSLGTDYCSPQQKIWNHSKTAAANIATDLFLIGLFLAILRTLHLGRRERCGVVIFLTISAIPVLAAILRLIIVILALRPAIKDRNPQDDQRFKEILYLASQIEVTTAFIAACLPAMRVFVREKKEKKQYRATSLEYKGGHLRSPQPALVRAPTLYGSDDESYWEDDIGLEVGSDTGLCPPSEHHHHQLHHHQ